MSLESLIDQQESEHRTALTKSAVMSFDSDPEVTASNRKKVKSQGLPSPLALPAKRKATTNDLHAKIEAFKSLRGQTAEYLKKPEVAGVAHDDHENMTMFEGLVNAFKGAGARMAQGVNSAAGSMLDAFGLKQGSQAYKEGAEYWKRIAEKSGSTGIPAKVYEGIGQAPQGVAEFVAGVPYAAAKGAAEGYQKDGLKGLVTGALTESVKRFGIGKVFKGIANSAMTPVKKSLTMAVTMGAQTAAEGGTIQDVVASTVTGLVLMPPKSGTHGEAIRSDLVKQGVEPKIAEEIGTHVDGIAAHENAGQIKDIIDTANQSKLKKRDAELFKSFTRDASKESAPVEMPVDKFDEMLSEKGLRPEDVFDDPTQYYEAKYEGDKVELTPAELAGISEHVMPEHVKDMSVEGAPSVNTIEKMQSDTEQGKATQEAQTGIIRPAVQTEEGIKTGADGERHTDIVKDAPEQDRGFLAPDGEFLNRADASAWLELNRPDLYAKLPKDQKSELHSEGLWQAQGVPVSYRNTVYRGTAERESLHSGGMGKGIYYTSSEKIAKSYAEDFSEKPGQVTEHDVALDNPYYAETLDDVFKILPDDSHKLKEGESLYQLDLRQQDEITNILQKQGYDGIVLRNSLDPRSGEYVKADEIVKFPEEKTTITLHAGINPLYGVKAAMKLAGDVRNSAVGKKVEKLMTPGIEAMHGIERGIKSLVLPSAKSPEHLQAAELLGAKLGKMHRNQEVAADLLKPDLDMFDKMGVHNEKIDLTDNPGIKFMSDMSQGRELEPKLKEASDKISGLFEDRLKQLEEADVPLETVRENYFPGMWTNESRKAFNLAIGGAKEAGKGKTPRHGYQGEYGQELPLEAWTDADKQYVRERVKTLLEGGKGSEKDGLQFLARTPFKGKESFKKQKVFDDIMTAVEFGLEPISTNPIDLVKLKLGEMDRSIMANSALKEWRAKGEEKFLRVGEKVPEGWVKVDDRYGKVYGPPDMAGEGVFVGRPYLGDRIVKEHVSDILNNYLSSSIYNNKYFGTLYKGYMGAANALNQSQLGVGSFFHVGFTESEVVISGGANLLKDIYGVAVGNRTFKQLGKTALQMPEAFIKTPMEGDAILKEWRNPGSSMNPKVRDVAKAAELAGGGFKMEQGLKTEQTAKLIQDWYSEHKVRAALRSPVAAVELMAKPIMEWLVPRQKAGVFGHLAIRIMEQNPDKTLEQLTPEFRQAWNRIDARLGQVRYDRMFMNNAAKNAVQGLVRAPGWSGGTIAEIGGSLKDTVKFLKEWSDTGKAPQELPDRVAYTMSLMLTVTAVNGLLTKLFTGDDPNGTDWWAFRTGGTDEYGRPERFVLPTYQKDVYAYLQAPGKTLLAKAHPIISIMGDIIRNRDYYGVTIANEDDSFIERQIERGTYVLKQFTPFWIRGAQKEAERGGGLVKTLQEQPQKLIAPQVGIMPATSEYTKTPAEKLLSEYIGQQIPQGGRTQEEADTSKAKRELVRVLRMGGTVDDLPIELQDKVAKLTDKQMSQIEKDAELTPLQASFKHLQDSNLEKSIKVWKQASDKEREELRDIYDERINKYLISHNLDDEEIEKLNERIDAAEERR